MVMVQLGAQPAKPQWEIDRDERRRVEQQRVADEEKAAEELRRTHRTVSHIPVQLLIAILNDALRRHDCRTVMWRQRWGNEPRTSAGKDFDFMAYQLWRAAWPSVVNPSTEEENELKQDVPAVFGRERTIAQLEARMPPEREMETESYEEVKRRGVDSYYSRSTRVNYQTEHERRQADIVDALERRQRHMRRVIATLREEFGDAFARARMIPGETAIGAKREMTWN